MEIKTEQIIAYLEGKLTSEEQKAFEHLLNTSAELKKEVEDIAFVWRTSAELQLHKKVNTDRNWKKVSSRIQTDRYRAGLWNFARSAAAILLLPLLAMVSILYIQLNNLLDEPITQLATTAAYGTVTKVTLPDGTFVWLNSGATLSYPESFRGNKRTVRLEGEAYFEVQSDKSNRFDVLVADDFTISAYGTAFNINGYKEDKTIEVTLVTGNVELKTADNIVITNITPGQHAIFDKADKTMDVAYANLAVKTGWKDGKMMFRRAGMTEIVRRLSRHFNVDIRLEGKELYDYEYTATFTTETLNEILHLLKKSAPIDYSIIEPEQSDDYSFTKRTVIISMKK